MYLARLKLLNAQLFHLHHISWLHLNQIAKMSKRKSAGSSSQNIKKFLKAESSDGSKTEASVSGNEAPYLKSFDKFMEKIDADRAKVSRSSPFFLVIPMTLSLIIFFYTSARKINHGF